MTQRGNNFFPVPRARDRSYIDDPFEEFGVATGISIRRRGHLKSDFSRRRRKLIRFDPSLEHEMLGPAIAQFTGYNPGGRWDKMRLPSTVPDGFLSGSTPAPYGGPGGSGSARGTARVRRTITEEQRNAERAEATTRALVGQNEMLHHQASMRDNFTQSQIWNAAKEAMSNGVSMTQNMRHYLETKRIKGGRNRVTINDLIEHIVKEDELHKAVMDNLERSGVRRGTPGRRGRQAPSVRKPSLREITTFYTPSKLTSGRTAEQVQAGDAINAPSSTDDPIPLEVMEATEEKEGVVDASVNPNEEPPSPAYVHPHGRRPTPLPSPPLPHRTRSHTRHPPPAPGRKFARSKNFRDYVDTSGGN